MTSSFLRAKLWQPLDARFAFQQVTTQAPPASDSRSKHLPTKTLWTTGVTFSNQKYDEGKAAVHKTQLNHDKRKDKNSDIAYFQKASALCLNRVSGFQFSCSRLKKLRDDTYILFRDSTRQRSAHSVYL